MPMYQLIKYSDNYSKTSGSLWQYYRDEANDRLTDSKSFKSEIKITGKTSNNGNTKDIEIIVPLKYLSNLWRILEMPLINCELNLNLTWSSTCVNTISTSAGRFAVTDTKLYVPVVTLSNQDSAKLLEQFKSGFNRTVSRNKCQSDPKAYAQNQFLNHLVDPNFQRVNKLPVLSSETENDRTSHSEYYLPKVEIKD